MHDIEIIVAPFHAGARCQRVGNGPARLLAAGLLQALDEEGARARIFEIASVDAFEGEVGRSFEIMRRISTHVFAVRQAGRFPLVLAGNCNASVGVYAGLGKTDAHVVWFDAHPDFDTPDECVSGYFDGMGVATLAGQCWRRIATTIPGFRQVELSKLVYCGIRDFGPGQREKVESHGIRAVYGSASRAVNFPAALEACLSGLAGQVMIHLDLDCLDTSVGLANEYAAPGGLSADDLAACMNRITARSRPVAMTIASFNPDLAGSEAIAAAGVRAAKIIAGAIA